jgi:hypothetical protein
MPDATDEELSILEFLGSSFYSPERLDAAGHWHTSPIVDGAYEQNDFTVVKREGSALTIKVAGRYRDHATGFSGSETGTVLYNASRGAPDSIRLRDVWQASRNAVIYNENGIEGHEEQALDLVSDSAPGAASPNPH